MVNFCYYKDAFSNVEFIWSKIHLHSNAEISSWLFFLFYFVLFLFLFCWECNNITKVILSTNVVEETTIKLNFKIVPECLLWKYEYFLPLKLHFRKIITHTSWIPWRFFIFKWNFSNSKIELNSSLVQWWIISLA